MAADGDKSSVGKSSTRKRREERAVKREVETKKIDKRKLIGKKKRKIIGLPSA